VKIHGALMQGLSGGPGQAGPREGEVELARKCKAGRSASAVQDANTMAVLWQLGVEFIQGYFVNAPEEVVLATGDAHFPMSRRSTFRQGPRAEGTSRRRAGRGAE
jgi:EAL domain-containing protein (putative c-di-GMP-specific phosphodiesterase class I)